MTVKRLAPLTVSLLAALALGLLAGAAPAGAQPLANQDCVKCHAQQPKDIEAAGLAHKDLGCQECHTGHRPTSPNNIPKCSQCHEGEPHFELENCLGCHKNPHTPRVVTFAKNLTEPCLTCHQDQIAQLKTFPSKHSKLACSFCHDVHRVKPECTKCHEPHADTMTAADCGTCHRAHQPKNVTYPATVSNTMCAACHKTPASLLAATQTRHGKVTCVQCHKDKHKTIPQCADCHQIKHPEGIMKKFPDCLTCHNHPHDLNNFPPPAPKKK